MLTAAHQDGIFTLNISGTELTVSTSPSAWPVQQPGRVYLLSQIDVLMIRQYWHLTDFFLEKLCYVPVHL